MLSEGQTIIVEIPNEFGTITEITGTVTRVGVKTFTVATDRELHVFGWDEIESAWDEVPVEISSEEGLTD